MKAFLITSFLAVVSFSASAQFSINSASNSNVPANNSLYIGNFGDSGNRMRLVTTSLAVFDYYPDLYFRSGSTSSLPTRVVFKNNGNVGIGRTNPSYKLDVNGTIRIQSSIYTSDKRMKNNIEYLAQRPSIVGISSNSAKGAMSRLTQLRGVSYYWKTPGNKLYNDPITGEVYEEPVLDQKDDHKKYGFIAQEVKEVFPELVYEDEDGYLGIDYIALIPMLVEAVKEQQDEIDALKAEIKNIKTK